MRKLRVRLDGGLGNQLFQISAGFAYAKDKNMSIIFYIPSSGRTDFSHQFDSSLFDVSSISNSRKFPFNFDPLTKALNRVLRSLPRLQQLLRIHAPIEIGFDPELLRNPKWRTLIGYFQSYKYLELARPSLQDFLKVVEPSSWYNHEKESLSHSEKISLHVRRGDFVTLREVHGILGKSYYQQAIDLARRKFPSAEILVFSDDSEKAKVLLAGLDDNIRFTDPPKASAPGESLALMWECSAHIIANSTFSWWGAAMAMKSEFVVAPKQWMRNGVEIRDLIPPTWIQIDSDWED